MVDISDNHGARGDWDPFVCVSINDVDVLVSLRGQNHCKLTSVRCKDLIIKLKKMTLFSSTQG